MFSVIHLCLWGASLVFFLQIVVKCKLADHVSLTEYTFLLKMSKFPRRDSLYYCSNVYITASFISVWCFTALLWFNHVFWHFFVSHLIWVYGSSELCCSKWKGELLNPFILLRYSFKKLGPYDSSISVILWHLLIPHW